MLQAPIIAFLISIVFNNASEVVNALFVLVIAAIWLGCSNAAREIVSEQAIFKRERMVNLKVASYLMSKFLVLTILCIIQTFILTSITYHALNFNTSYLDIFVILLKTSISALSIGLFVSSAVNTNESAMALIPIVLIPQVILGGLISKFADMSDFIKFLAGFMLSRWSFEAILISEYDSKNSFLVSSIGFVVNNFYLDIVIIILFTIVFYFLTAFALKKKDLK